MQDSLTIFESEIQNLLSEYLAKDEYEKIFIDLNHHQIGSSDISARISDLYKKQLDIKIDESADRIQIDRAITLAEKKLESDKFYHFTLDLGNICIAIGKINFAQEIFSRISKKSNDKNIKAKSLIGLADVYSRKANWTRGISFVTEAESIFNENIGQAIGKYQYQAASPTADTVNDTRFRNNAGVLTFEKCTVANATKGAGTWVVTLTIP